MDIYGRISVRIQESDIMTDNKKRIRKLLRMPVLLSLLLTGCKNTAQTEESAEVNVEIVATPTPEQRLEIKITDWLSSHSLKERVAQLFIVQPEALCNEKTVSEIEMENALKEYPVGGIIYFSDNLIDPEQTKGMIANTKKYYKDNGNLPPFISVDEEGGLVARIGNAGTFGVETFDPMWYTGETGDPANATYVGTTIGTYLHNLGFNLDFAPDADVLTNPYNYVIGTRAFSDDPHVVSAMVQAESLAMKKTGVMPVIKHFPGHGGTLGDTHEGYAYTDKTLDQLMKSELIPFQECIENKMADMIMVAHISVPSILGDNTPCSLSEYMITDVLRKQMGYDGLVITDSFSMGVIVNAYDSGTAALQALQAGVDILLMPQDFHQAYDAVIHAVESGTISEERINASVRRILRVKLKW